MEQTDLTVEQLQSTIKGMNEVIDAIGDIDNPYHRGSLNVIFNTASILRMDCEIALEVRGVDVNN